MTSDIEPKKKSLRYNIQQNLFNILVAFYIKGSFYKKSNGISIHVENTKLFLDEVWMVINSQVQKLESKKKVSLKNTLNNMPAKFRLFL